MYFFFYRFENVISCDVVYVHPQEDETNTLVEMGGGGRGRKNERERKKNKRQDTV